MTNFTNSHSIHFKFLVKNINSCSVNFRVEVTFTKLQRGLYMQHFLHPCCYPAKFIYCIFMLEICCKLVFALTKSVSLIN